MAKPIPENATLEELADRCDDYAENANYHDFVGIHRILAAILHHEAGREMATKIMRVIAEYDGLDGMARGGRKVWDDFGIAEPWNDWALTDKGEG